MLLLAAWMQAQDFSDLKVEKIAAGLRFTEGPVWSKDGYLIFSDIPNNRMAKWVPGRGVEPFRENTQGANGNAFDATGRLYSCQGRGRKVVRTTKEGALETVVDQYQGKKLNAPNDVVVRRDGQVYFTDPAFGEAADHRELDFYGVYHITPKGEASVIAKPQGRPNGVTLSPNGRILYVTNSDERNVRAYDLDRDGRATNERVLIQNIEGVPDGIRVDEKGNLYVACKGLAIYSPKGELLKMIEMAETPSNCAFGDADYQTLFITARTSVYRVRLTVKGAVQQQ